MYSLRPGLGPDCRVSGPVLAPTPPRLEEAVLLGLSRELDERPLVGVPPVLRCLELVGLAVRGLLGLHVGAIVVRPAVRARLGVLREDLRELRDLGRCEVGHGVLRWLGVHFAPTPTPIVRRGEREHLI